MSFIKRKFKEKPSASHNCPCHLVWSHHGESTEDQSLALQENNRRKVNLCFNHSCLTWDHSSRPFQSVYLSPNMLWTTWIIILTSARFCLSEIKKNASAFYCWEEGSELFFFLSILFFLLYMHEFFFMVQVFHPFFLSEVQSQLLMKTMGVTALKVSVLFLTPSLKDFMSNAAERQTRQSKRLTG